MTNPPETEEEEIEWTLTEIPIKEINEHPKNPRQIGREQFERLGNFIRKFGLIDKPIVNQDMTLIGGHQRLRILKKRKKKVVKCWVPERLLDEKEVEELMIGLNKIHGSFDYDILGNQYEVLDLFNYGFTEKELLDSCKKAEEILEKAQGKEKKKKMCPHCGNEL